MDTVHPQLPKVDKGFISMFMGFVDGHGYIEIGPHKQYNNKGTARTTIRARLSIRLHNRDLSLLEYFKNTLEVGKIDKIENDQVRLNFYRDDLKKVIMPLINNYSLFFFFLVFNRRTQYNILKHIIDNDIIHRDSLDLDKIKFLLPPLPGSAQEIRNLSWFNDWLIGFCMSEGSFGFKNDGSAFFFLYVKLV